MPNGLFCFFCFFSGGPSSDRFCAGPAAAATDIVFLVSSSSSFLTSRLPPSSPVSRLRLFVPLMSAASVIPPDQALEGRKKKEFCWDFFVSVKNQMSRKQD